MPAGVTWLASQWAKREPLGAMQWKACARELTGPQTFFFFNYKDRYWKQTCDGKAGLCRKLLEIRECRPSRNQTVCYLKSSNLALKTRVELIAETCKQLFTEHPGLLQPGLLLLSSQNLCLLSIIKCRHALGLCIQLMEQSISPRRFSFPGGYCLQGKWAVRRW